MRIEIARTGRIALALLTAMAMAMALAVVLAGPAVADHIPDTGTVPDYCVEFQAGETGTKSPPDYPSVDITLDSWEDDPSDPHIVNFTISGLTANQFVDLSVKSGQNVQEPGGYGNGSHTFDNEFQNAISHVRFCVFEEEPEETTTTTEPEETTTTTEPEETTTTVEETTTTSIEDEVLDTTITTQPEETTSSIEDEVLAEEVLPFTGMENTGLAGIAAVLTTLGLLVTLSARRIEE